MSAIEQLPLDLLILDNQLTVTYANAGAARRAGDTSAGVLSYSALTVVPTSAIPREALTAALAGAHYYDDAIAVPMPGAATRWFEVDVQPHVDIEERPVSSGFRASLIETARWAAFCASIRNCS